MRVGALRKMWVAVPYPARKTLAHFRRCWLLGGASLITSKAMPMVQRGDRRITPRVDTDLEKSPRTGSTLSFLILNLVPSQDDYINYV